MKTPKLGIYHSKGADPKVITYQIGKEMQAATGGLMFEEPARRPRLQIQQEKLQLQAGEYTVPAWGRNNLYPQEVDSMINENKLLPSLLQKRVQFLYGKGPVLYKEKYDPETGESRRMYGRFPNVENWLRTWKHDWREYLLAVAKDYYRYSTCVSRIVRSEYSGAILGLQHLSAADSRLATKEKYNTTDYKLNDDFETVLVGDWTQPSSGKLQVYQRDEDAYFFAEPQAGRRIYSYNEWYEGLREWVRASNLTPKYLNNYLKNALNAHVHCKIPESWYRNQADTLQRLCEVNIATENAGDRVKNYRGVALTDENGSPYAYNEAMMQDLIGCELEKITDMLSGEGKNQGKLYATLKVEGESWEFTDFPQKFKEYFDAVLQLDSRADQVTLAGVGISSSITNVEADGALSKSGSEVYYNYVVYLNTLTYAEQIICRAINQVLWEMFPDEGVQVGFRIEIPLRQQEISPEDRLVK